MNRNREQRHVVDRSHAAELEARRRDVAAVARDRAAEARDAELELPWTAAGRATDRRFAANDRAAAALDRREAASDRRSSHVDLHRAQHDELTGALLRHPGHAELSRAVARSHRTGEALVLVFVDVDGLKSINDRDGHAAGDRVLADVGSALRTSLRSYDLIVRYGGDEFVCAVADATLTDVSRRLEEAGRALRSVSFSAGVVSLLPGEAVSDVLERADAEMYRVRRVGRR